MLTLYESRPGHVSAFLWNAQLSYSAIAVGDAEASIGVQRLVELTRTYPIASHKIVVNWAGPGSFLPEEPIMLSKGTTELCSFD
jgi:hypothetical protein